MAIFHLSVTPISRGKGHSALAKAAYIEDRSMRDDRLGQTFRYGSNRTARHAGIETLGTMLPNGKFIPTEDLWNKAEAAEKRVDARTGRSIEAALPREFTPEMEREATLEMGAFIRDRYHTAMTLTIHRDKQGNHHWHGMIPSREFDPEKGAFTVKIKSLDGLKGPQEIEGIRAEWERICNEKLTRIAPEKRIDHRSYKRQGIAKTPQIHLGKAYYMGEEKSDRKKLYNAIEIVRKREKEAEDAHDRARKAKIAHQAIRRTSDKRLADRHQDLPGRPARPSMERARGTQENRIERDLEPRGFSAGAGTVDRPDRKRDKPHDWRGATRAGRPDNGTGGHDNSAGGQTGRAHEGRERPQWQAYRAAGKAISTALDGLKDAVRRLKAKVDLDTIHAIKHGEATHEHTRRPNQENRPIP